MQQVKDDLGADAVILHTKKYREGGILGFNAKEVVEVTAAIEDTPEPPKKKMPAKKPAKPASRIDVVSEPESSVVPPVTTAQRSQGLRTYGTQQQETDAAAEGERQAAQARFEIGQRVRHEILGLGTVVGVDEKKGAHLVQFDAMRTPRAIAFRAKLFAEE